MSAQHTDEQPGPSGSAPLKRAGKLLQDSKSASSLKSVAPLRPKPLSSKRSTKTKPLKCKLPPASPPAQPSPPASVASLPDHHTSLQQPILSLLPFLHLTLSLLLAELDAESICSAMSFHRTRSRSAAQSIQPPPSSTIATPAQSLGSTHLDSCYCSRCRPRELHPVGCCCSPCWALIHTDSLAEQGCQIQSPLAEQRTQISGSIRGRSQPQDQHHTLHPSMFLPLPPPPPPTTAHSAPTQPASSITTQPLMPTQLVSPAPVPSFPSFPFGSTPMPPTFPNASTSMPGYPYLVYPFQYYWPSYESYSMPAASTSTTHVAASEPDL